MVAGDLWMDNVNNQLYFYDGTDLVLAGPIYKAGQGETGFRIESVLDTQDRSRTLASLYLGNGTDGTTSRVAVISNVEFTPAVGYAISQNASFFCKLGQKKPKISSLVKCLHK